MKPILIIMLIAISSLTTGRVNASESAGTETATADCISELMPIKYAKVEDIADVLTCLSSSGGGHKDNIQLLVQRLRRHASIANDLPDLGHIKLLTDVRSNSLLISATRSDMETIKTIVSKLDVVVPQIVIEAVIIEVKLPNRGSSSKKPSRLRTPADLFAESGAMTNVQVAWVTNFAPLTATHTQRSQASGFSYLAGIGQDLDSMLTAIASESRVTLIQKPRILTGNEVAATLFLGLVNPNRWNGGQTYPGPRIGSLGVTLEMTPSIQRDGFLELDIRQTIAEVTGIVNIMNVGGVPATTTTEFLAKLKLHNHDTLMIGGMTNITEHELVAEVPVLKQMPKLRNLLRGLTRRTRGEIVVLLRPTVLPGLGTEYPSH